MPLGAGTLDGAPLGSNDKSAPPSGGDTHSGRLNGKDAPLT